jgi:RNA polymerase sigma-70 factor (ECF subfamily)
MPERVNEDMAAVAAIEPDAELMLRVKAGDAASFGLLLARHRDSVIRFLYRMVQRQAVAEELAQEVFLRVYRARAAYEPTAKFTTWLFRIAMHLALNNLRDERGERAGESLDEIIPDSPGRELPDRNPSVEQSLVAEVRLEEVRRAIQALPGKQRAAVLMHKYEEMDYAQIARTLNCSESGVKSLLFRAYESLRERLKEFV